MEQNAFCELYCTIFELLDEKFQIFTGLSKKTVLAELRSTVDVLFSSAPKSVAEFRKLSLLDVVKPKMKAARRGNPASLSKASSASSLQMTRNEYHSSVVLSESPAPNPSPRPPRAIHVNSPMLVHGVAKRATNDALMGVRQKREGKVYFLGTRRIPKKSWACTTYRLE
jgi:hypothetical protein